MPSYSSLVEINGPGNLDSNIFMYCVTSPYENNKHRGKWGKYEDLRENLNKWNLITVSLLIQF